MAAPAKNRRDSDAPTSMDAPPPEIVFGSDAYHPYYRDQLPFWRYWRAVYAGGKEAKSYLPKFSDEEDADYQTRQKETAFPRLSARALNVYSSHIFRKSPKRNLPESLKDLTGNFDGDGTNVDAFLSDFHRDVVMPEGLGLLLVTKPLSLVAANREQEIQQGIRPLVVPFSPLDLVKWDFDEAGNLLYAVLLDTYRESSSFHSVHVEYNLLRVWTQKWWALYHQPKENSVGVVPSAQEGQGTADGSSTHEMSKGTNWTLLSSGVHPLGEVPLVPVYNMRGGKLRGLTEMGTLGLADLNLDVYTKTTWLDQGLKYQGFPLLVIRSREEELKRVAHGPAFGIRLPGDTDEAKILETTGQALSISADTVKDRRRELLDTAFRQTTTTRETGGPESAEKKKLDMSQLAAAVSNKADNMEEAERSIWRLMAKWENQALGNLEELVSYQAEVTQDTYRATMKEIGELYATYEVIDHETAVDMIKSGGEFPEDITAEDIKARLRDSEMDWKNPPGDNQDDNQDDNQGDNQGDNQDDQ